MVNKKVAFLFLIALGLTIFLTQRFQEKEKYNTPAIAEKPTEIKVGSKIKVKYPQDYTIVLVGDSMTERMGNSDELRADLKKYYPGKTFEVLNYGFGSTNILSVQDRLEKDTFYGRTFRPILDINFDLILIESFGNNPLSQFPLDLGLKKQTEALDKIVQAISISNTQSKIAFVAIIAPNKWFYGKGQVDLSAEKRAEWVKERVAYINNHMEYAKTHNIPLIDIYTKSLNSSGDGNIEYLNKDDYIHPSPNGIYLISDEIANYIFENHLL